MAQTAQILTQAAKSAQMEQKWQQMAQIWTQTAQITQTAHMYGTTSVNRPFSKAENTPFLDLLGMEAFRRTKQFFFVCFPTYMSVPRFFICTHRAASLLAYL